MAHGQDVFISYKSEQHSWAARLGEDLERYGMPLRPPAGLDPDRVRAALALDKKVVAGGQRWVLLEDVGRPIVTADVPRDIVEAVMTELLAPA